MIDNMWFDTLQSHFVKRIFMKIVCYCHCQRLLSLVSPSLWVPYDGSSFRHIRGVCPVNLDVTVFQGRDPLGKINSEETSRVGALRPLW